MMSEKPRLLIADDSENVRKEMHDILEDEYDLVQAANGEEAWTLISNDKTIKLVFTDLEMPEVDGLTLLKRIRGDGDETVRKLPVVMMTDVHDDLNSVKESLASGVSDLVRKPFIPELLRARASANVRTHASKTQLTTATIDPLTQLANEPYFMLRGANNLSYAIRHNSGFGVLLIEIDNFAAFSKRFQAYVIESVQVKVGNYISSVVRSEDTVARLDSGKYGVLLQEIDPQGVLESAARIREKVKRKVFRCNDSRFTITISIGASAPALKPYYSFEMILRQARSELAAATAKGGDRIVATGIDQWLEAGRQNGDDVPSLEEALEILSKNQGKLLEHCAEELLSKLMPLLQFFDGKDKLDLLARIEKELKSRSA